MNVPRVHLPTSKNTVSLFFVNSVLSINSILMREIGMQANGRGSGMWCQWGYTGEHPITFNPAFLQCDFIIPMQNTYTPDANIIVQFIK